MGEQREKRTGGWTHFWDMHSGGDQKLDWPHIFIEADRDTACKMFMEAFGRNPENVTCDCCGDDYSVSESDTLAEATAFQRHLAFLSPVDWYNATREERKAAGPGRYFEPGEPIPDGWHQSFPNSRVELGYDKPLPIEDFLADPHFTDIGRRVEVKILARPVTPSGRNEEPK